MDERRTYVVVSDLHLTEGEDRGRSAWRRYKHPDHFIDAEFGDFLSHVEGVSGDAPVTLVINGDFIDFDSVTTVPTDGELSPTRVERKRGLRPTAARSAYKLRVVLDDHRPFFESLARFILRGNDVVYVLGNHDREMCFPEVRQTLLAGLAAHCEGAGDEERLAEHVRFEPWFYYVEGLLWIEHGHQYDRYCSFSYLLDPMVSRRGRRQAGEAEMELPLGGLTARYLMNGMGYFNPYAWTSFMLDAVGYARHWFRHYFLRPRSLLLTYLLGSLRIIWEIATLRAHFHELAGTRDAIDEQLEHIAERQAIAVERLLKVADRWRAPIIGSLWAVVQELALDRLLLFLLLALVFSGLALTDLSVAAKVGIPAVLIPALFLLYEQSVQTGGGIAAELETLEELAAVVAREVGVPYVVFGHTHDPKHVPLSPDSTYFNVGTWAPVFEDPHCRKPVSGLRRYLLFMQRGADLSVQFGLWEADEDATGTS